MSIDMREMDLSGAGLFLSNTAQVTPMSFKENNELDMVSKKIQEYVYMKMAEDKVDSEDITPELVVSYISKYLKEDSAQPNLHVLEKYAVLCAQGFHENQAILKNEVYKDVCTLTKEVTRLTNQYLKDAGVDKLDDVPEADEVTDENNVPAGKDDNVTSEGTDDVASEGTSTPPSEEEELGNMEELKWDNILGDTSLLMDTLEMDTKCPGIRKLSTNHCTPMYNSLRTHADRSIELPAEVRITLISNIVNKTGRDSDAVSQLVDMLLNKDKYHKFYYNGFVATEGRSSIDLVRCFADNLTFAKPILEAMENEDYDLNEEDESLLKSNIRNMLTACDIMRYYILCKRDYFKRSILLDTNCINGDTKEEYLKHGTIQDLKNYVMYYIDYKKIPMQASGITVQTFIDNKERYANNVAELKAYILSQKATYKKIAQKKAFYNVGLEYLHKLDPARVPKDMSKATYVSQQHNKLMSSMYDVFNSDGNVEDLLYKFVIDTNYPNSPVGQMYNYYKQETVKGIETINTISTVDPNTVEAVICTKMLLKVFIDYFTE